MRVCYDPGVTSSMTLTSLLFEDPTMLLLGLLGVAVVLWALARRHGDTRLLRGAGVAMAVAIAILLLSYFVETTRERLIARTRAAIAAATSPDPASQQAFRAMLSPQAILAGGAPGGTSGSGGWLDSEGIVQHAKTLGERYPDWRHKIIAIDARRDADDQGISGFKLRSTLAQDTPVPIPSHWELIWTQDSDGVWRIAEIRMLSIFNQTPTREVLE